MLLGIIGSSLGAAIGMLSAMNARGFSRMLIGYAPPMTVPWGMIFIGVGSVMVVTLLASLWPAFHVARREPLELLQAGRASA
jgi:putative ABC transport system permease protein